MEHDLRLESREDAPERDRITDIDALELRARGDVARGSRREIVHHADRVAASHQAIDDVGADESRSTRHQRARALARHAVTIPNCGHVFQRPRVKSGNSAGRPPLATDHSERGVTTLSATAS